jgi:hypothetical protein
MTLTSYSKIYALGHRATKDILSGPVVVQEKIDGSQISFGVRNGELFVRSKGTEQHLDSPDKLFAPGIAAIVERKGRFMEGWTYRGEYLSRPKHNALAYDRIPRNHIMVFDVDTGNQSYVDPDTLQVIAGAVDFECVPTLFRGTVESFDSIKHMLDTTSVLGGQKPEGLVVKNYAMYDTDKKVLMAKYVTEAFKEVHRNQWGASNPGRADIIVRLIDGFKTPARWNKAVQHLREAGTLDESPKDIGPLMKEVGQDIYAEEADAIKEALFKHFWPQVQRGVTAGLPQWYKDTLAASAFNAEVATVV